MAELKLAANFVTLTAKLDHWSLRWAAPENSGHLQIIYSDGGFFQEAEVQINEGIPMGGDWTFATFGRPHGGTSGDAEGDNTNYISSTDEVENAARYKTVDLSLREGQTQEGVWELLGQAHASLAANGVDLNYDGDQNSNAYATTMLAIIGIDVLDLLPSLIQGDIEGFPSAGVNVLKGGKLNAFGTGEGEIDMVLSGTTDGDYIQTGIGNDRLSGQSGNDSIFASFGADNIAGGVGNDTLDGSVGADILYDNGPVYELGDTEGPTDEERFAYDGDGNDSLEGGEGADVLIYSGGTDVFDGGAGNDTYIVAPDAATANGENDDLTIILREEDANDSRTWFGNDLIVGSGLGIGQVVFEGLTSDQVTFNYNIETEVVFDTVTSEFPTQFIHLLGVPSFNLGDYPVYSVTGSLEILVNDTLSSIYIQNVSAAYIGGNNNVSGNIYVPPSFSSPFGLVFDDITSYQWNDVISPNGTTVLVSDDLSENADAATQRHIDERDIEENMPPPLFIEIIGSGDAEFLQGGDQSEIIEGNGGDDTLDGGGSDDLLEGGDGADDLNGGEGNDRASYLGSNSSVTVDLLNGTGTGGDAEGDTFTSIEDIEGSEFSDSIIGDDGNNFLFGLSGNDTIRGGGLGDLLQGGSGNDRLFGDDGGDRLIGEEGNDYLYGGVGEDELFGGEGDDWLEGGFGTAIDYLDGGAGNDTLLSRGGNAYLDGGSGADKLFGSTAVDLMYGGSGDDLLTLDMGDDLYDGGEGYDILTAEFITSSLADRYIDLEQGVAQARYSTDASIGIGTNQLASIEAYLGGLGEDQVFGTSGDNLLSGGRSDDELHGLAGNDTLYGGLNDDTLYGGDGDDALYGGSDNSSTSTGSDLIFGGAGTDTTYYNDVFEDYTFSTQDGVLFVTHSGGDIDEIASDVDFITFTNSSNTWGELAAIHVNSEPIAGDDIVAVTVGETITLDPRLNDSDPDGDPLNIVAINGSAFGPNSTTTIISPEIDLAISMTTVGGLGFEADDFLGLGLAPGETYVATVTYTVSDGLGGFADADITVTVTGAGMVANTAPIAVSDSLTVAENQVSEIDVVANDTDADGDPLSVTMVGGQSISVENPVTLMSGAIVALLPNGALSYDPNGAFESLNTGENASETITYTVSDGQGGTTTGTLSVTIEGSEPLIYNDVFGTSGDERILGTSGDDRIYDYEGRDEIIGRAGADVFVMAMDGDNDQIKDFADGEDMIDISTWGVTDLSQLIITQDGAHVRVRFDLEDIEVQGFTATNFSAEDFIFADGPIDPPDPVDPPEPVYNDVFGTSGDERILGTSGDDRIYDYEGRDEIIGRAGADVFVMAMDGDNDQIKDFADGEDMIDISTWGVTDLSQLIITQDGAHVRVRFDLEDIEVQGFTATNFSAEDFIFTDGPIDPPDPVDPPEPVYNDVFGTSGDERILGTSGDDRIYDYEGRDEIIGRAGADVFVMAMDGDNDQIKDFADGEDMIDISTWGVTNLSQLIITQDGAHVRVRFDLEDIEVQGFTATNFSAEDFIFT